MSIKESRLFSLVHKVRNIFVSAEGQEIRGIPWLKYLSIWWTNILTNTYYFFYISRFMVFVFLCIWFWWITIVKLLWTLFFPPISVYWTNLFNLVISYDIRWIQLPPNLNYENQTVILPWFIIYFLKINILKLFEFINLLLFIKLFVIYL